MKKIEYDENMLEEDYINRFLNMIANEYDGGLARQFEKYYILKCKEIERLNKRIFTLEETIRKANNNIIKDIAMIKTHEMIKQEIVQRLVETSKILESGSDEECM